MRDCFLSKCIVAYAGILSLWLSWLLAQEVPKSGDESFDIEPPLLVKPWERQSVPDDSGEAALPLEAAKLAQRLEERGKARPRPHGWLKLECCQKSKRSSEHYALLGWSQSWPRRK